jgi:hypothetical protein
MKRSISCLAVSTEVTRGWVNARAMLSGLKYDFARMKQLIALFVLVPLVSAVSVAADKASGWFSPRCDGASFYLSNVAGLSSRQTLILNLRQYNLSWWIYRPQETWTDVYAEQCTLKEKCEPANGARIWLDRIGPSDKRTSGKYEVNFGNRHLAGEFAVKYRKEKNVSICE